MFAGSPQRAIVDGHLNTAEVQAFKREAQVVADRLIQEHCRETMALYNDNQKIKQELARVVDMMNNFMQREKQLHDMLASLTDSHTSITRDLHGKVSEAVGHGHNVAGHSKNKAGEMLNLHQATVNELARIKSILGSPSAGQPGAGQLQPGYNSHPAVGGISPPLPMSPQQHYSPPQTMNSPPQVLPIPVAHEIPDVMQHPQAMMTPHPGAPGVMTVPPGYAAAMVYGEDRNRNGIPDIMEAPARAATPPVFRMM